MNVNVRLVSIAAVAGTVLVLVLFLVVAVAKGGVGATSSAGVVTIIGFIATLIGLLANLVAQTAMAVKVADTHAVVVPLAAKVEKVEERLNGIDGPPSA